MDKIKRNQLAELIVEDGQPSRAIINYLQETMSLLSNFDCVTDYYSKIDGHPLITSIPNLKLTKELFLDAVSTSYSELRNINEKHLEITDLYINFNFEYSSNDEDFNEEFDTPEFGYYLSTSKEASSCSDFMIIFKKQFIQPTIIASIEVSYLGVEYDYSDYKEGIKFKKTNEDNEYINLVISGTEGDTQIEYKEEDIECIIPLDKISF